MANPDLSLLAAYPGEYQQELISDLYSDLRLEAEGISVIPNVKNKMNMHKLLVGKGVKPSTGIFKSKDSDINFQPRVLEVAPAQRDITIQPKKYLPTFMAQQRGRGEGANNMTIPFAEFMWKAVLKELGTEVNRGTVYNGVGSAAFAAYNPATAYAVGDFITYTQDNELRYFECITATAAGQSPDSHPAKWDWAGGKALTKGFGKIITDEIANATISPVATGAVTAVNAYDKVMQLFRSLPEEVKMGLSGQPVIYQSMTDYEFLMDAYETQVSKNFEVIDGITYLAKTEKRCGIKPVSWLSGRRRQIATVLGNLVAGTDELGDLNEIKTIPQMYTVDAGITFVIGFQIQDLAVIRVSDQA